MFELLGINRLCKNKEYDKVIERILKSAGINHSYIYMYEEDWDSLCEKKNIYETFCGASKFVISLKYEDFVFKIPLLGTDCEHLFCNAKYPKERGHGNDYCRSESEYYELAAAAGVEQFFAKTELLFIDKKFNFPVYKQEKCITYADKTEELSESDFNSFYNSPKLEKSSALIKETKCERFTIRFVGELIDSYGEEMTKKFLTFMNENDLASDMYDENYGYRLSDGKPVVFDYSGYDG